VLCWALTVLTFSLVFTGGLFATLLIRWMLTTVGTTVRIPAGFFTPMIMIGAIIGTELRCCGAILRMHGVAKSLTLV
jgi:H+/Cl- antiporter ClcA